MIFLFKTLLCLSACMVFIPVIRAGTVPCQIKDFGDGSYVCVCNATYCDTVEQTTKQKEGIYSLYLSDVNSDRFLHSYGSFNEISYSPGVLVVNRNVTYQSVIGFGGAFTDAAGINILNLSAGAQEKLMKSYYSEDGIEYTLGRIPMASCDFSTHPYSYDDNPGDFNLSKFALAPEDIKYKIPLIKEAMKISNKTINLFGSPWSAPAWMKTNQNMTGKGTLIGKPGEKYFQTWALYFAKFIQEYKKNGINLWGVTLQNEPSDGNIENFSFQAMGWNPEMQRDFIVKDLGPTLAKYGLDDVKLMILDDARLLLPYWAEKVFSSSEARKLVSGVAVHWYEDFLTPTIALTSTHDKYPEKFILATEACNAYLPWELPKVKLGDWERGENYAHDIIQDLNNWVSGWTDWNIALDLQGGPNWVKNFVDSPVIVNAEKDEFYKQPMFYILGHFSKFIPPGSKRIELHLKGTIDGNLEYVAFVRPDSSIVAVVLNRSDKEILVALQDEKLGYLNLDMIPHSIQTVMWW